MLMMWFPQSWQWIYERSAWLQWVALPSPVLNDLFSHIAHQPGQGKGSQSVCRELVTGRICPPSISQHSHLSHLALTMMLK